jgi:HAMP domain-containing protein
MAENERQENKQAPAEEIRGMPGTLLRGLKVVVSELKWLLISMLRSIEIRQMNKKLDQEFRMLGQRVYRALSGREKGQAMPEPDQEIELAMKQIDFLRDEIAHLKNEKNRMRSEMVESRSRELGFDRAGEQQG